MCPQVPSDMMGICPEDCNNDFSCNGSQKCCSNGCGHTCMLPVNFTGPSKGVYICLAFNLFFAVNYNTVLVIKMSWFDQEVWKKIRIIISINKRVTHRKETLHLLPNIFIPCVILDLNIKKILYSYVYYVRHKLVSFDSFTNSLILFRPRFGGFGVFALFKC